MAQISRLSRLLNGVQRGVDLTANTLVVQDIQLGGLAGTVLTKTILDRLISTQDGSTLTAGTYHKHHATDALYDRTDGSKKDIQTSSDDVESALTDLDDAKISKTGSIAYTGNQPMGGFKLTGLAAGSGAGDSVRYEQAILASGANAWSANQSVGGFKFTSLAAGTTAGDSVRYEQAILTSGANAFGADQSMGSHKLTNVSDPTSAQDAATKAYVDSLADGRDWKQHVMAATTAALANAPGYSNGTAGVGATLTGGSNSALPAQDGVTLVQGDRLLVKNQAAALQNGIYTLTQVGDGSNPYVLTRSTDNDTSAEMRSAAVFVEQGSTQADYQYGQTTDAPVMGTDSIVWVITSANSFSGHDMITLTGGQISVDLAAASGLESTNPGNAAGQLRIKLEASNPTLKFTGSNELAAKLNTGATTGNITTSATGLKVDTDGSTIETAANALQVKDAGITTAKLAANSADDTKIRLRNAQFLRARNAANSGDVSILEVDASDIIQFASFPRKSGTPTNADELVNKSYVDGLSSGVITEAVVAGESFSANTTYAVRWAVNGETAGRVYKADDDATTTDKFHVVGMLKVGTALSAGDPATLTKFGSLSQASSDTPFGGTDIGKPVYLTTAGAWSVTPSSTASHANVIIGYVKTTTVMDVKSLQIQGVN